MTKPRSCITALCLLFMVSLTACGDAASQAGSEAAEGPSATSATSTAQTVDATVVESAAPVGELPWRIGTTPIMSSPIPPATAGSPPPRIIAAIELSDGTVVAADAGRHELLWLASDGTLRHRRTGAGTEPGSFRSIAALLPLEGDSVLLYDVNLRSATPFGPDGEPGRTFGMSGFPVELAPVTRFPDGGFLLGGASGSIPSAAPGPVTIRRPPVDILRYYPATQERTVLARVPGMEIGMVPAPGTPTGFAHDPRVTFARATLVAGSATGWTTLDTAGHDLHFWSPEGDLRTIARRVADLRAVEDEDRRNTLVDVENMAVRRTVEQLWQGWAGALPETQPTASGLLLDPSGNAWVREFDPSGMDSHIWQIFSADGRWMGTANAPPGLRILAITGDRVIGLRSGPDGLDATIAIHPLEDVPGE